MLKTLAVFLGTVFIFACNNAKQETKPQIAESEQEIQTLILAAIQWGFEDSSIDLVPVVEDEQDERYVSVDEPALKQNLQALSKSELFTQGFIDNYQSIVYAINTKLENGDEVWEVGDLSPFSFASDASPWCLCQDFSSEDFQRIEKVNLNEENGEFKFIWKDNSSWKNFIFKVKKENNRWKISFLEGFGSI